MNTVDPTAITLLTLALFREQGRAILVISLVVVAVTMGIVAAGLLALGWPAPVAVLLGAIATSTAPAAVSDVVREADARGPFTRMLLGIVAVDDAWGIVVVTIALTWDLGLQSADAASLAARDGAVELGGAVLVAVRWVSRWRSSRVASAPGSQPSARLLEVCCCAAGSPFCSTSRFSWRR